MLTPDEGYYFGLGAFETIAVEAGRPILLEKHLNRLQKAADFLNISLKEKDVSDRIQDVLLLEEMQTGRKVIKVTLSEKNLTVTSRENTYTKEQYQKGVITDFSTVARNETSPFTFHKTLNYGDCIQQKRLAKQRSIDEPIFLNTKGMIAEGACTNVFFVHNGQLYTPEKHCGLLPGIMRAYICDHYDVKKEEIFPSHLSFFDEMFVTNSLLGIMPVVSLGEHRFPSRKVGDQLLQEYMQFCKHY